MIKVNINIKKVDRLFVNIFKATQSSILDIFPFLSVIFSDLFHLVSMLHDFYPYSSLLDSSFLAASNFLSVQNLQPEHLKFTKPKKKMNNTDP